MYGLADINNFYASCEKLFRPDLEGKPVVVLSNNDGCVIARSNEAKALGIQMGEPAFYRKQLFKEYNVWVFSSNYTLYGDLSQRVMATFADRVPAIEVYSIDEAFFDFRGMREDLLAYIRQLRYLIKRNVGLPVSIGAAPTKTLAKIANKLAKQDPAGVCCLRNEKEIDDALRQTPLDDVWGIGSQHLAFLNRHNIHTACDLVHAPEEWVRQHMSVVSLRMVQELKGKPRQALELRPEAKKAICTSRSFGKLQTEFDAIREAVASYAHRCAEKLRREHSCANAVTVFVHTNQFRTQDPQYRKNIVLRLLSPSNSSMEITKTALKGLRAIYKRGYQYKKAGVIVSEIVPANQVQANLFSGANRQKFDRASRAMDHINGKLGRNKVKLGAQGTAKRWDLKQEQLSPCYTTRWEDLLVINVNKHVLSQLTVGRRPDPY